MWAARAVARWCDWRGEAGVTTTALGDVLRGEAALRPRLLAAGLAGLSFIGSWALHVIIGVHRELARAGRLLALVGVLRGRSRGFSGWTGWSPVFRQRG